MILCALALLAFVAAVGAAPNQTTQNGVSAEAHLVVSPDELKWQHLPMNWADGPPPAGFDLGRTEVAIIRGDPTREGGPSVFRLRSTPGTQLPPHWHSG